MRSTKSETRRKKSTLSTKGRQRQGARGHGGKSKDLTKRNKIPSSVMPSSRRHGHRAVKEAGKGGVGRKIKDADCKKREKKIACSLKSGAKKGSQDE